MILQIRQDGRGIGGKWVLGSGHLKVYLTYYLYYTLLFDEMTAFSVFLTQAEPIIPF